MFDAVRYPDYAIMLAGALFFGHLVVMLTFRLLGVLPEPTKPDGSRKSDILAYNITATCALFRLASVGWWAYNNVMPDLEEDRFYKRSSYVEKELCTLMMAYQAWNAFACYMHTDLCSFAMIFHHVITCPVAYFAHDFGHYYAIFWFGMTELTNVPYSTYEYFQFFPWLKKNAILKIVYFFAQGLFVVGHFYIRIYMWSCLSIPFTLGCINLVHDGQAHNSAVVIGLMLANASLSVLQWMWGWTIIGMLYDMAFGSQTDKKTV